MRGRRCAVVADSWSEACNSDSFTPTAATMGGHPSTPHATRRHPAGTAQTLRGEPTTTARRSLRLLRAGRQGRRASATTLWPPEDMTLPALPRSGVLRLVASQQRGQRGTSISTLLRLV